MFTKLDFFIALRYLRSKKSESFISVVSLFSLLGIALGVAALIVVMAVMNGFRIELTKKIVAFDGDIGVYSHEGKIIDFEEITKQIKSLKVVQNVFPMIEKQALVSSADDLTMGAQIRAISENDLQNKKLIANNLIYGELKNFTADNAIIVGSTLAFNLKVIVGDEIKIISPQTNTTIMGKLPRFKTFKIIAIFESGMSEYDSIAIFMSLTAAQKFFKMNDYVNTLEIHSINPQHSHQYKAQISELIGGNLMVNDWQTKNISFFNALKTERVVMFLILALIILVAAFNIISSLIMLVKDKTADIAVLRTMGATKSTIVKVFLLCGSFLGVVGTLMGVILGVSFAANIEEIKLFFESITRTSLFNPLIYYLSELPSDIQARDIIRIIILSLGLSFSATIYPAWRAATIDPVKALRL